MLCPCLLNRHALWKASRFWKLFSSEGKEIHLRSKKVPWLKDMPLVHLHPSRPFPCCPQFVGTLCPVPGLALCCDPTFWAIPSAEAEYGAGSRDSPASRLGPMSSSTGSANSLGQQVASS